MNAGKQIRDDPFDIPLRIHKRERGVIGKHNHTGCGRIRHIRRFQGGKDRYVVLGQRQVLLAEIEFELGIGDGHLVHRIIQFPFQVLSVQRQGKIHDH